MSADEKRLQSPATGTPLTTDERALLRKLLQFPLDLPEEFKSFLVNWINTNPVFIPAQIASNARVAVKKAGATAGIRRNLNLIDGADVSMTVADNPASERVDVTVALPSTVSTNARTAVKKGGALTGTRRGVNFIEGQDLSITTADQAASEHVDVTLALPTTVNTNARAAIKKAGVVTGTRRGVNFIEGGDTLLTVTDQPASEHVDVTVALPTTLAANGRVAVRKNSAGSVFTRRRLNLIEGVGMVGGITIADDAGNEEVDVTLALPFDFNAGSFTVTFAANTTSGEQSVSHGLGGTPTAVLVTSGHTTGGTEHCCATVRSVGASTFLCQGEIVEQINSSNTFTVYWCAFR